jgi:Tfp pilus assembly protein PilO
MRKQYLIAGGVVILFVFFVLYLLPLKEKRHNVREELFIKEKTLKSYVELTGRREEVEKELEELDSLFGEKKKKFINAENDSLGMVMVQEIVRDYAEEASLKLLSVRSLDRVRFAFLMGMPIQLTATGDMKQVSEFLRLIDKSQYFISVDAMNIQVMNVKDPDALRVKMIFSGYMDADKSAEKS